MGIIHMWQGATGYRQADIRRTIIHILWALTRKIWSLFLILHGALICRNVLPVDWNCMRLKYHVFSKGVKLILILGKTKLRIKVNRVVMSDGSEKFDTPLGIFQENEVDMLIISLLRMQKKTRTGVS